MVVMNPDPIILDVRLPHVDRLEVCRAIRQRVGQSVGIIMISGIKKEMVDRVVGLEWASEQSRRLLPLDWLRRE